MTNFADRPVKFEMAFWQPFCLRKGYALKYFKAIKFKMLDYWALN